MVFDIVESRKLMANEGLDCIVATSHDNVFYSSGSEIMTITLLKRMATVFIPLYGEPTFGVHANEFVTAHNTTWIRDLRVYEGGEWEPLKPIRFMVDILKEKGLAKAKIGIEMMDIAGLCLDHLRKLLPSAEFFDCQAIFDKMRSVKSSEELKLLSEANMATAKAITVAFEIARPGDTEREIAHNMIDLTLEYGADQIAFMTLGAGKNVFETHHTPSNYKIKNGDMIHVDFGGCFEGYLSDISRMAGVKKPDDTQLKAYDLVIQAERITAEALREGARVIDVHNTVKGFYDSKGYKYERMFIGHGIGIGCHELPFLGPPHGDWILEKGMFLQIEPSLALDHARVHTEDSFIVGKGTAKNVSLYRDTSELQIIK